MDDPVSERARCEPPDVIELVHACRQQPIQQLAWERFHARYSHLIRLCINITARTSSIEDREDFYQMVWARMPTILAKFDPGKGPLAPFLETITKRVVRTEWRRRERQRRFNQPIDDVLGELVKQSPVEQDAALLWTLIFEFLERNVNDIAKLRVYEDWIEGKSHEEIMKIHKLSRAVVFRRFQECRRLVQWALGIRQNKGL